MSTTALIATLLACCKETWFRVNPSLLEFGIYKLRKPEKEKEFEQTFICTVNVDHGNDNNTFN